MAAISVPDHALLKLTGFKPSAYVEADEKYPEGRKANWWVEREFRGEELVVAQSMGKEWVARGAWDVSLTAKTYQGKFYQYNFATGKWSTLSQVQARMRKAA